MGTAKYPSELKQTIEQLACESSYGSVCHKHLHDKPMPSTQTLRELVDLLREILFPGYFGHSEVRTDSIHYYLGVNTERVFNLTVVATVFSAMLKPVFASTGLSFTSVTVTVI